MQVANCETTARVMREEEARLEEVYNRWKHKKKHKYRHKHKHKHNRWTFLNWDRCFSIKKITTSGLKLSY